MVYDIDELKIIKQEKDVYNKPLPPTSTDIKGFIDEKITMVKDKNGQDTVCSHTIRVEGHIDISPGDKMEVDGKQYFVIAVAKPKGFTDRVTRVYFDKNLSR